MNNPPLQLNDYSNKLIKILKVFLLGLILLMISSLILIDPNSLVSYLFAFIFIALTVFNPNYRVAGISIFFCLSNIMNNFIFLSLRIQNKTLDIELIDKINKNKYVASIICQCISVIFHFFLIYFLFETLKELKAIAMGILETSSYNGNQYYGYSELSQNDIDKNETKKFPGKGIIIG
jgi:hypothetical protein